MFKEMKVFSGSANPELAKEITKRLKKPLGKIELKRFADGEIYANYLEKVRGVDVYIIQPTCSPQNDNLMELLIMIDAAKRASAGRITAVVPYYGYAKQDRKAADREPITAKLVADLISTAGANHILVMDLHADQIQGFFGIQADFLYASTDIVRYLKQKKLKNVVIVSPDFGAIKRARAYAKELNASVAVIDKRRPRQNMAEVINVIGRVKGKNAIIVDDEINTAGTIVNAAEALKKRGAREVYAVATHAVFAGPAVKRLKKSAFKEVIVSNSIPLPKSKRFSKLRVISTAPILAEAIKALHTGGSLSKLLSR